jgi:hypothetical protein
MFKINLNLYERFQILQRIPQKGSYQAMICNNAVKALIEVNSGDIEAFKIEEIKDGDQTTGIKWDNNIDTTKEFELKNKVELQVLVDILKEMDKNEEITNETMALAQKVFTLSAEAGLYDPTKAEESESPVEVVE